MLYVLYLYRCIGCMEVFSSKENAQRHEHRCKSAGYVAMTLGVVATLALGVGLMALMYYSNRSGRD